ncbi:MAG: hypothetical protein HPY69_11800 [Armatimonadetes bacterium]|nr:hypothetical protein [Armatimonadota bacterium]
MAEPTPRELALSALRHEETDRIPCNFMLSPPALAKLQGHLGRDEVDEFLGNCLYLYGCSDKPLYANPDKYGPTIADQYGVVWATSHADRGYPLEHPLRSPSLQDYQFPDPLEPRRWERVPQAATLHPECLRLAVVGDLWERANFLRGLQPLLLDLREHPRFVHELLDHIAAYNLATLEGMVAYAPDGIFISDDYGLQAGLMMSPMDWREFVKPRLELLLRAAQSHGLRTMLHSCGCVREIIPDLIELGLDILHPIQPEAMDIRALKREYGRDLTFCGGVGTQQLLPAATPDEVRAEVWRTAEDMGRGGGYILEPGITIQGDVPLGNLLALVETAHAYRRRRP